MVSSETDAGTMKYSGKLVTRQKQEVHKVYLKQITAFIRQLKLDHQVLRQMKIPVTINVHMISHNDHIKHGGKAHG